MNEIGFRQSGAEQNAVYQTAELFANDLLTDNDDYAARWDTTKTGRFIFDTTWALHVVDAIEAETVNLHQNDVQRTPGRIHNLYRHLAALLDALDNFMKHSEDVEDISDHYLLDSRRRRDLYVQEQERGRVQVEPLRPLIFRPFEALSRIVGRNGERVISARSSVSTNADNTEQDDARLINDEYVTAMRDALHEERAQGRTSNRLNMTMDILQRLGRLTNVLDRPGQYPRPQNQAGFDRLQDIDTARMNGRELEHGWGTNARERRIAHLLQRTVVRADTVEHINPERERRRQNLHTLEENMHAAEPLLEGRPDPVYIEGLRETLRQNYDLWSSTAAQRDAGNALRNFLSNLRHAATQHAMFEGLPENLRRHSAGNDIIEYRNRLNGFDEHETVVGSLYEFERLVGILDYVRVWER
jgi:hypothetical protein